MVTIIDTDDELRKLIYVTPYLAVKYHNQNFQACRELYPVFEKYSELDKYRDIVFVRVNADENQIAKKIIEKNVYSFISVYKNGLLLESKTVSGEQHISEVLNFLVEKIKEG